MAVKLSREGAGKFGVVGHVGVGHVHSHSGFVQDDSAGFAVAALILKEALDVDTTVAAVSGDVISGKITVTTAAGGVGEVFARRGLTPAEVRLLSAAVGQDAVFTQNLAVRTFGRIYGQGALEAPVALQGAAALAVLDSFRKNAASSNFSFMKEKLPHKYDTTMAAVVELDELPVSLLLVVNGTDGGIGPDEDYEGNTDWQEKGRLMKKVGLDQIPTVVIESKAFIPAMAETVAENMYMVRAEEGVDCMELAEALYESGRRQELPIRLEKHLMPLKKGSLAQATRDFAQSVIETAEKLKNVDSAADKVQLTAELARLVSEDAGGVTFMSNSVHDVMRGAGTLPNKKTAVLSMLTTKDYQKEWKIPMLTMEDAAGYKNIIYSALKRLAQMKGL